MSSPEYYGYYGYSGYAYAGIDADSWESQTGEASHSEDAEEVKR
jgi:hypothetical protein